MPSRRTRLLSLAPWAQTRVAFAALVLALATPGCDFDFTRFSSAPECDPALAECFVDGGTNAGDPAVTGSGGSANPADPGTGSAAAPSSSGDAPSPSDTSTDGATSSEPLPTDPSLEPIECDAPSLDKVRAYFEVPGAEGGKPGDYFRLPFPNDFYLTAGKMDLGDFPRATAIAGKFVDSVNALESGFSASPTLIFRFSGKVNFNDTLIERFHVLDITDPASPSSPPLKLLFSPRGGKYVCHDWLAARPSAGHALLPGHTYAAWLDKGVLADNGLEVEVAEHFTALMAAAAPTDPVLASLYAKYEPLRRYFTATAIDPAQILNATVFHVAEVRAPMQALSALVQAAPAPIVADWVRCEAGVVSPCPEALEGRACGATTAQYEEYHALVELPIFQHGDAPYFDDGGAIDTTAVVRSEQVCVSLTVPTGAPPAEGYALLVAAHGAGGSFRSHVRPEMAGLLSEATSPTGDVRRFAVLGYDGVQHGPRRGSDSLHSNLDPELLLFNILNPSGALGTSLQGAVDVLSMTRAARELTLPVEISGRAEVAFDHRHVYFWGQSQGAMQGAVGLPYSDDVAAAVFSGLGAGFLQTLLLRQDPPLISAAVRSAVADPGADGELVFGGDYHPALALVQQLVDPADPLNHAKLLVSSVQTNPLHVFQVYGSHDAFAPSIAQKSFAIAAGLAVVQTDPSAEPADDLGAIDAAFPLSGNVVLGDSPFTAGVRQYGPAAGANGHFVAFDVPNAGLDIATFLAQAANGETPQIGR